MKLVRDLYSKLRSKVNNVFRAPREQDDLRSTRAKPLPAVREFASGERMNRYQRMTVWCRGFNSRNGHIVPARSPESIYRRAHSGLALSASKRARSGGAL